MRLLQALPFASSSGVFGGPVSVAISQARSLLTVGDEVEIAGGWLGEAPPPTSLGSVPASLFTARRVLPVGAFSGLIAPGLVGWWKRHAAEFDVVHLHTGRHLSSLLLGRSVRRSGIPYVVQTHGMLPPTKRPDAAVLDATLVAPLLQNAAAVLTLTTRENRELRDQFGDELNLVHIDNAVEMPPARRATSAIQHNPPRVLFLGRVHERKRPVDLVLAVAAIRRQGLDCRLDIVGPDEGQARVVTQAIAANELSGQVQLRGPVDHDQALEIIKAADVFVLPSVDEPFPMTVLEALSVGTPVIVTTSCGIADILDTADAAGVVEPNVEALSAELQLLLTDETLRQRRAANGLELVRTSLSPAGVAEELDAIYAAAAGYATIRGSGTS